MELIGQNQFPSPVDIPMGIDKTPELRHGRLSCCQVQHWTRGAQISGFSFWICLLKSRSPDKAPGKAPPCQTGSLGSSATAVSDSSKKSPTLPNRNSGMKFRYLHRPGILQHLPGYTAVSISPSVRRKQEIVDILLLMDVPSTLDQSASVNPKFYDV